MPERVVRGLYAASIVDTIREPLMLLTDDLRILMANRSSYELFGVDARHFDGRSPHRPAPWGHHDRRQSAGAGRAFHRSPAGAPQGSFMTSSNAGTTLMADDDPEDR